MEKHPEIQFLPREEIKKYQEGRLKETLAYLSAKSPFYQRLFVENDIDINEIRTLEDLRRIPVTTKRDLQLHGAEFCCVKSLTIPRHRARSATR